MPPVTAKVPGKGTSTLTFTIPASGMDVETVYVEVNGSGAGGAILGTLEIADQSGVVIAAKPQDATMDAAAGVSATWALRLNGEGSSGGGTGLSRFNGTYTGNNVTVGAGGFGQLAWDTLARGDAVLDLSTPSAPTVTRTGYWAFTVDFAPAGAGLTAGANYTGQFDAADSAAAGSEALCDGESALATALNPTPPLSFGATVWLTSGSALSLSVINNDSVDRDFALVQAVAAFIGGP